MPVITLSSAPLVMALIICSVDSPVSEVTAIGNPTTGIVFDATGEAAKDCAFHCALANIPDQPCVLSKYASRYCGAAPTEAVNAASCCSKVCSNGASLTA